MQLSHSKILLWTAIVILAVAFGLCLPKCKQLNRDERTEIKSAKASSKLRNERSQFPKVAEYNSVSNREIDWEDSELGSVFRTRLNLRMLAETEVTEQSDQATADVSITIFEGAEFWDEGEGVWKEMDAVQFRRWNAAQNDFDPARCHTTASVTTRLNPAADELVIVNQTAMGTAKNDPKRDWSMSDASISLQLDWKDDVLNVRWQSVVLGVEATDVAVEMPFSPKFTFPRDVTD